MSARPLAFRGAHPEADCLAAWLEGRLAPPARERLQHHLAYCAACREWAWLVAQAQASVAAELTTRRAVRIPAAAWSAAAALCLAAGAGAFVWWQPLPPLPTPAAISAPLLTTPRAAPAARAGVAPPPARPALPAAATAAAVTPPPAAAAVASSLPPPSSAAFVPVTTGFVDQPQHPVAVPAVALRDGSLSGPRPTFASLAARMTPPLMPAASAAPTVADLEREVGTRYAGARAVRASAVSDFAAAGDGFGPAGFAPPFGGAAGMIGAAAPQVVSQVASDVGWVSTRGDNILHKVGAEFLSGGSSDPAVQARAIGGAGDRIWAAGFSNQVWTSPDGSHWQKVDLPTGDADPTAILSIAFRDARHGTISAADGRAWRTTDAGQHWRLARQP